MDDRLPPANLAPEEALDPADREARLARAVAEFLDRHSAGEPVDPEQFCAQHADLQPELHEQLEALDLFAEQETAASPAAAREAAGAQEELPERLSGHRILGEIGSGGMGRVLLAADERLGRKVAIKVLAPRFQKNEQLRTRFMQEARSLARLNHPHIVHIYHLGQPEEAPHFVMEFVDGVPLTDAARALPVPQKVELFCKVVRAVDFLHQHQIVHRDLKPGNILVGADLEPKLLDFGLARQLDDSMRLTQTGEVMGTPHYFSPEHGSGAEPDARSDVFSLGAILYELLTGTLPFREETLGDQIRSIRKKDPVLPRRLNTQLPGELQNICMKALEKDPAERYGSAREMAEDLERFLAGEPVLAAPSSYSRLMAGQIAQHLRVLDGWRQDRILSEQEYDSLRKRYERLTEREDAWIMEVRHLSLPQVSLYLGAWFLVLGAALIFLFLYRELKGPAAVLAVAAATLPTGYYGIRCWQDGRLRISVAYLLAFCLLLPISLLVAMAEFGWFTGLTQNDESRELFYLFDSFKRATNAQLWWAIVFSLPAYVWLRRFTKSSVYTLVFAVMLAALWIVTLFRLEALEWLRHEEYIGHFFLQFIPAAIGFLYCGSLLERQGLPNDSRYFYPLGVLFSYGALSGVAALHQPYQEWLARAFPWTRGQVEYLFILNAGIYVVLHFACERTRTSQMRAVAKAFRFVIPGHILTSLLLLGIWATERWDGSAEEISLMREARIFEVLLPVAACGFVFASIPKQMKNYLATGMIFLAIGVIRLQQNWLKDSSAWPLLLLAAGILLMLWAARYAVVKVMVLRWYRRLARQEKMASPPDSQ